MRLVLVLALMTGCATLFSTDTTTLQISANPGQQVLLDGAPAGLSPTSIVVDNHRSHIVTVGNNSCYLTSSVGAGWVILDIVAGLVPIVIDAVTGEWSGMDAEVCQL
jgi:hypothetical protein